MPTREHPIIVAEETRENNPTANRGGAIAGCVWLGACAVALWTAIIWLVAR